MFLKAKAISFKDADGNGSVRWEGRGWRGAGREGCLLLPRGLSPFGFLRSTFAHRSMTLPEAAAFLDASQSQSKGGTGQGQGCERDWESQAGLTPVQTGGGNLAGWRWERAAPWQDNTRLKHLCQKPPSSPRAAFLLDCNKMKNFTAFTFAALNFCLRKLTVSFLVAQ